MTPEEKKLLREILTKAHNDYRKGLKKRALFKTGHNETSQDLVQQTFMKTWVYLVKGGKIETMKAFLHHVLNHLIVDEYRRHRTLSLDALMEKGFEPKKTDERSVLHVLDGKAALLLIERLPTRYRRVMRMKYVQNLNLKEMSLLTGISRNTVAVQIHRGLKKIKILHNP